MPTTRTTRQPNGALVVEITYLPTEVALLFPGLLPALQHVTGKVWRCGLCGAAWDVGHVCASVLPQQAIGNGHSAAVLPTPPLGVPAETSVPPETILEPARGLSGDLATSAGIAIDTMVDGETLLQSCGHTYAAIIGSTPDGYRCGACAPPAQTGEAPDTTEETVWAWLVRTEGEPMDRDVWAIALEKAQVPQRGQAELWRTDIERARALLAGRVA